MQKTALIMVISAIFLGVPGIGRAQFHTIKKKTGVEHLILKPSMRDSIKTDIQQVTTLGRNFIDVDSILESMMPKYISLENEECEKPSNYRVRKKHLGFTEYRDRLPKLTISNLLNEIRLNGIKHERIVLAQAILETGWFTSPVCRNQHNLFGLTNPRTKKYYEFNHWTESVRAYYTKVQYRYKGGNYLLWLDEIGYAEDPRYVSSLIQIIKQYLL